MQEFKQPRETMHLLELFHYCPFCRPYYLVDGLWTYPTCFDQNSAAYV